MTWGCGEVAMSWESCCSCASMAARCAEVGLLRLQARHVEIDGLRLLHDGGDLLGQAVLLALERGEERRPAPNSAWSRA